jgi:excisionase family DNA binding protein
VSEDSLKQELAGSPLMTAEEVAALLRTSKKAIYAMNERGLLPGGVRVRRRLLFRRNALVLWLDQNRVPSPNNGVRR